MRSTVWWLYSQYKEDWVVEVRRHCRLVRASRQIRPCYRWASRPRNWVSLSGVLVSIAYVVLTRWDLGTHGIAWQGYFAAFNRIETRIACLLRVNFPNSCLDHVRPAYLIRRNVCHGRVLPGKCNARDLGRRNFRSVDRGEDRHD